MHPLRKQRLIFVLLIVFGLGTAAGLVLFALKQNINLFYTPTQVIAGAAPKAHSFRVGGLVRKGSVHRDKNNLRVKFVVTDTVKNMTVIYTGILPDLFHEGRGVIAEGQLNAEGVFVAQEILAKHDEKYMPPQVADELRTAHDS